MAETQPAKNTARKTTAKRTTRTRAAASSSTARKTTRRAAAPRRATATAATTSRRNGLLTLRAVLIVVLTLAVGATGAFFYGYNADGQINVSERLADTANHVQQDENDTNAPPIPTAAPTRPALQ